jgi:hypothetical protein
VNEGLSDQERLVVAKLAEAWNEFLKLSIEHGDDQGEFRYAIHLAQEKILARPARREMNAEGAKA